MTLTVLEKDRAQGFVELATRLSKLHACISDNDTHTCSMTDDKFRVAMLTQIVGNVSMRNFIDYISIWVEKNKSI